MRTIRHGASWHLTNVIALFAAALVGCGGGSNVGGTGGAGTASGSGGAGTTGTGGVGAATGSGGVATGGAQGSGGSGAGSGGTAAGGAQGSGGSGAATGSGGSAGTRATGTGGAGGTIGSGGSASPGGAGGNVGPPIIDLFNGTDLTGFNVYKATTTANNSPGMLLTGTDAQMIFKPENGMIHVYGDLPDQSLQSHYLLQTVASYVKYNLSWDYKWGAKKFMIDATGRGLDLTLYPRDAGVLWQIHGDRTQIWPSSIEFQNKWGSTGDIYALYAQCKSLGLANNLSQFAEAANGGIPMTVIGGLTQHARNANWETPGVGANASSGVGSDWNSCLLQVDSGIAVYTVNGHVVNRTSGVMNTAGNPVTTGTIAWQAEQAEVFYRNLRIQVLP